MRHREQGFTLLELMIVVVIVGILAAIAIPSFRNYVYRAKASQGITTLGEIRQRQEAYRAEFGQYCGSGVTATITPSVPGRNAVAYPSPMPDDWRMLGFSPRGYTYFGFATEAGAPGAVPTGGLGFAGYQDFWFVANATCDLDGDGTQFFFEIYSPTQSLYASNQMGWE